MSSYQENFNFLVIINSNVSNYVGPHSRIIQKAPMLYETAVNLLRDAQVHSNIRLKLLAAIGYFIIPNDIFPEEEHGAIGYVEDIMLLIHIFREINNSKGKLPLLRNWPGTESELIETLGINFEELKVAFPMIFEEALKFSGI
jgi:uncharacterized membrane protein YkvA (DUF1232 family)